MKKKILIFPVIVVIILAVFTASYFIIDMNRVSITVDVTQTNAGIDVDYNVNNNSNHSICVEAKDIYTNQYQYLSLADESACIIEKKTSVNFEKTYVCDTKSDFETIRSDFSDREIQFKIHYATPNTIFSNSKKIVVRTQKE